MRLKIIYKTISLIAILIALNFIYQKWFFENDLQKHSDIVNSVRNIPNNADIIYIAESSNKTFREDDKDKRAISDFIGDYYPQLNLHDISNPATHSGIYKVLLASIPKENQVKTIIVTLNIRSFDASWIYSDLETPLQKSMVLLKEKPPLYNRFLLSFKGYDIKTKKERKEQFLEKWIVDEFKPSNEFQFKNVREWDDWLATKGAKKKENGEYDKENTELACHYVKTYAFQIDTMTNPRIQDFNDIVELAKERNWNLVFNLLGENIEKAKELVGDELVMMMNKNAELLVKYYHNKGVTVINNLNSVEDEQFIDQNWTTEHYAEKGRKIIARNTAFSLKKWYDKDFVGVEIKK